jgi:hypothetical protein
MKDPQDLFSDHILDDKALARLSYEDQLDRLRENLLKMYDAGQTDITFNLMQVLQPQSEQPVIDQNFQTPGEVEEEVKQVELPPPEEFS